MSFADSKDARIALQNILGTSMDGVIVHGGETEAAFLRLMAVPVGQPWPPLPIAHGEIATRPGWSFSVRVDGDDLVMDNVNATDFGGDSDSMDNGQTASGFATRGHDGFIGVSLPMRRDNVFDKRHGYVLRNSPIPAMPFGVHADDSDNPIGVHVDITFHSNNVTIENVPVIELGPANWTGNAVDCTIGLARKIQPNATANNFKAMVTVRIKGAAKYLA